MQSVSNFLFKCLISVVVIKIWKFLLNEPFLSIIVYVLLAVYVVDNIISYSIINNFSTTVKKSNYDNTEEVTKYVKDEFLKKSYLSKRLIYAYPNFQTRVRRKLAKIKEALNE